MLADGRYEDVSRWASVAWHTDVSFERVPADYSMLKINTLPTMGGDTLWANTADVSEDLLGDVDGRYWIG